MSDRPLRAHARGTDATGSATSRRGAEMGTSQVLSIRIPGSTANLGPGFDALGLALSVYCNLKFTILPEADPTIPLVTVLGATVNELPLGETNLIYRILSDLWHSDLELLRRVRISIHSDIPLGRGLGSSAAAIVGAVWAAHVLQGSTPTVSAVLEQATAIEGHGDNVAASLLGGLVVCSEKNKRVITQRLEWPDDWRTLVVVPPRALSTHEARAALPPVVSHKDAVHNVQNVALLLAAVANHDENAFKHALHDRLHQPFRESLIPELPAVRAALSGVPILGCVLSGAGPSVLVLVNKRHQKQVFETLVEWASLQADAPQILSLEVDKEGLQATHE